MTDVQLYAQISSLPSDLKKEVSDFVGYLKSKRKASIKIKERQFGYAKGKILMHHLKTLKITCSDRLSARYPHVSLVY